MEQISGATREIERLDAEREQLRAALLAAGHQADQGIRRLIWADGSELVAAATEVLIDLGFSIRDMDTELEHGDPKREDLRLRHEICPDVEAIVEVKGYTNGVRTNDARQIREHRDRYIAETGRSPDLTIWLANPFRGQDPASRSAPGSNVGEAAGNVGAVLVLASDLYLCWTLVAAGDLEADEVVKSFTESAPGLWDPPFSTT